MAEATVVSGKAINCAHCVYNIEVHSEHVYQVGRNGLLVHNACPYDVLNVTEHALQEAHNWKKILGGTKATLESIKPYVDDVLANGTWQKVGDAYGRGGKLIGEIFQAEHNGVWVRALKDLAGKIIVNNAGAL